MIDEARKANFDTILQAAKSNRLALMECRDKKTGKPVYVICAVNHEPDGSYDMVPLAKMFDENPFEELDPPSEGRLEVDQPTETLPS